jgi:hypothetical protein
MAKMKEVRTYKTPVYVPRIKQQVRFGRSVSGRYGLFTNNVMAMPLPAESATWSLQQLRDAAARYDFDFVEG